MAMSTDGGSGVPKTFIPSEFQPKFSFENLIIDRAPQPADAVSFDVVIVGAGPAGLSAAIELDRLVKSDPSVGSIEIGVIDKAASLGGHSLSGAVVDPRAFKELFPDLKEADFPFRKKVIDEKVYLLTNNRKILLPTPPPMKNDGYFTASLCEIVRWLGQKAEERGVNILTSFPVGALFMQGTQVVGVQTVPAGLTRDGQPGGNFMPETEISARIVALSEGTRGTLANAYMKKMGINAKIPQTYALGVKEVWQVPKAPQGIIHTMGWPLSNDTFGGSFMYPLADDIVSIGLVVGLDYHSSRVDVHQLLQQMKQHPLFDAVLSGGKCLEWGAKTIPEGGYYALPQHFSGDGLVMMGDAVGLVNVPALKGIHYAMMSGILAARAIFKALKLNDVSGKQLQSYDQSIRESFIWRDLHEVRNMRHAFKSGFLWGGIKAALMAATKGAISIGQADILKDAMEDAQEPRTVLLGPEPQPVGMSKLDAVYLSGNKTRDDIPQHLIVGKHIPAEVAEFYSHVCPAGVYELRDGVLVVNAANCIDCKATDILGPRWTPREGGSGPDYKLM